MARRGCGEIQRRRSGEPVTAEARRAVGWHRPARPELFSLVQRRVLALLCRSVDLS